MNARNEVNRIALKIAVMLLSIAMLFTMMPTLGGSFAYAGNQDLEIETPALVVTGQGVIGNDGVYSSNNVSKEKSYTLDELKALDGVTGQMYSARKSKDPYTRSYSMVDGVKISSLLDNLSTYEGLIRVVANDGYAAVFEKNATYTNDGKTQYKDETSKELIGGKPGLNGGRYYYDGFNAASKTAVPAVISWAFSTKEGSNGQAPTTKPTATENKPVMRLFVGQYDGEGGGPDDMNEPLFNGNIDKKAGINQLIEGDDIDEVVLTVGSEKYTRADILLMDFAERNYTYDSQSGSTTDKVRGVPFSVLLDGQDDNAEVSFTAADGYDMSKSSKTVGDLIEGNYMLAYEVNDSGVYATAKSTAPNPAGYGLLTMYGDDVKPAKMINGVSVSSGGIDFAKSPYKHITNGGKTGQSGPYNIDAITGATLTIEGPGAESSVPLAVKDLESKNNGCYRGDYTDVRDGSNTERTYEGVDLNYILHNMQSGTNGIKLTDKANKVVIKNQNRESISSFTLAEIEQASNAKKPILVAYGTSYKDGTSIKPFVFDYSAGGDEDLGNYDGCLKLVYDYNTYGTDNNYKTFSNMAYIYVEEEEEPGYKHDIDPYKSAENSQYIVTLTGDTLGYEINYTVDDIENLVEYDEDKNVKANSLYGYRDEYSLANSTYWYVNEYEGVKLWSLLQRAGLPASAATDNSTKDAMVSFKSTDNYGDFDLFKLSQIADENQFSFYKKNTADPGDGTYQGDERIRQWDEATKQWIGDKVKSGYPVLVAYGVNKYPYVKSNKLDGYLSGLQNDGGPLRVIWGKTDYAHANGSHQAKYLDKILVGENNYHYVTHKYNSDSRYTALADNTLAVKVTSETDSGTKTLVDKNYKVSEIEDIVYDGTLPASELADAKIKAKYQGKKGYSDVYEGVNLNYFLSNDVGLSGTQGTVTFKDAAGEPHIYDLEKLLNLNGVNKETGVTGLAPLLAYGKNGYPLVADSKAAGFVSDKKLAEGTDFENTVTVKNQGGPLMVLVPSEDSSKDGEYISNVTDIEISLETDKYAHVYEPYDSYENNTLTVKGEGTKLTGEKTFKVGELESKQNLLETADYSFRNSSGFVTQLRYRGIKLNDFLKSINVGLKSNADKVIIKTTDNSTYEYEIGDISRKYRNTELAEPVDNLPVMLAFGSSAVTNENIKDGKPLVQSKDSEGYDSSYSNDGGPLKLIFGQTDESDENESKCVKSVASIEVTAGEMQRWTHNQGVFTQYLTDTFNVVIKDDKGDEIYTKEYSVADLEAMESLILRETMSTTGTAEYEGLGLYKFVEQECKEAEVDVNALRTVNVIKNRPSETYAVDILGKVGKDEFENGVKDGSDRISILLAYAVDGYPLAFGDKKDPKGEGYDSTVGNDCGPIRLMVHNSQGACISEVNKLELILGEGGTQAEPDFTINSSTTEEPFEFSIADLKQLTAIEKEYSTKNGSEKVRGVMLDDLLKEANIEDEASTFNIDAGGYDGSGTYQGILLKDAIEQEYIVAYEVYDSEKEEWAAIEDNEKTPNSKVRIYRRYLENHPEADQSKWFNKCQNISGLTVTVPERTVFTQYDDKTETGLRTITMDDNYNLWFGLYGGGLSVKKAGRDSITTYNTVSTPALKTTFTSAVATDAKGGVWFSQNASYTQPNDNQGVGYLKDGEITWYDTTSKPGTIPNNYVQSIEIDEDGNVWFGSFGGLTKYEPKTGKWQTWDTKNGFPAESVDAIAFDGNGGIWVGFYPESDAQDGSKPWTGGFAYFKDGRVVKSYRFVSPEDRIMAKTYRLGDVWVRDFAVDNEGNAWVVASGSYNGMDNKGGVIWYAPAGGGEAVRYTGFDLLGEEYFAGAGNSEVRTVEFDPDGGLWFGTSADGIIYVENPIVTQEKLTVTETYNYSTKSWNKRNYNNVYSLDFFGKTLYVGTAAGAAAYTFDFENARGQMNGTMGDSSADKCDFAIIGGGVENDVYYSIKGLKNSGVEKRSLTYHWENSSGSSGDTAFEGAYIEDLLAMVGLREDAAEVTAIASDGNESVLNLDTVTSQDLQGYKPMLAWSEAGEKCDLKLVIGQYSSGEANKSKWNKDIVKLVVDVKHGNAAAIGETEYETLEEAVAAAKTRETIKLLKKSSGNAIQIPSAKKGIILTFDLNGFEYVCKGIAVEEGQNKIESALKAVFAGSKDKAAFYIGSGNTVTIKNGKLSAKGNIESIIYNDGATVNIDGTKISGAELDETSACVVSTGGKMTITGDTGIVAAEGATALSASGNKGSEVAINTTGSVNGNLDLQCEKVGITNINLTGDITKNDNTKLEIAGGSFETAPEQGWMKAGLVTIKGTDGTFKVFTQADALAYQAEEINKLLKELEDQKTELDNQASQIEDQAAELESQAAELRSQSAELESQAAVITSQAEEITRQATEIETLKASLSQQMIIIAEQQRLIEELQAKQAETEAVLNLSLMNLKATAKATNYSTVTVSWSCDGQPDGYLLDGEDVGMLKTKKFTGLKTGKASKHTIAAYMRVNGKRLAGKPIVVSATPKLSATKFTYAKSSKRIVTLKWKKVAGANGYVVYRSTKKTSGFKAVKTIKKQRTITYKSKKLKKGKKYYFKVRAYRLVNGKRVYSAYTAAKYIIIK